MKRPYRIWNERTQEYLRWCCYSSAQSAHYSIMRHLWQFQRVGDVYTLENIDSHRAIAQYKRTLRDGTNSISWSKV